MSYTIFMQKNINVYQKIPHPKNYRFEKKISAKKIKIFKNINIYSAIPSISIWFLFLFKNISWLIKNESKRVLWVGIRIDSNFENRF